MDTTVRELRHAFRALLRRPAFALTAAVTLALGIGATTAVFSVVDTVLLRALPYPDTDELIVVGHGVPRIATGEWGLSRAGYFYFREHAASLEDIGVYRSGSTVITGDGPPERLGRAHITWSVLSTLDVAPQLGRSFTIDDDLPGSAPVAILSHRLWTRSFGADVDVVGRTVMLDGNRHEIVGVMPRSFRFPSSATDLWVPYRFDPEATPVNQHIFSAIARLHEGLDVENARAELQQLVERFPEDLPPAYTDEFMERSGFHVITRSLIDDTVGSSRSLLWIVMAAAGLVLVVACANVANLMLLRSESRRREVAVRAALGASRGALFRYALSEAGILAFAGGALGIAIAWVGVRALVVSAPAGLPRIDEIALQPTALLAAFATAAAAALVLGGSSALRSRAGLVEHLKAGSRSTADGKRLRLRGGLVVTQVAMALVLLVGSGLLLRSFFNLTAVDPGFSVDNVLTIELSLSPVRHETSEAAFTFFEQVTDRFRDLPGVTAAGVVDGLPLASRAADNANGLADLPDGGEQIALMDTKFAGPGYFEALGMRVIEGRTFDRGDMDPSNAGAILTRAMAEQFWPNESALGKRVRPLMRDYPWHTVVGIIEDVRVEDITRAVEPTVYFPYTDLDWMRSFSFAIRTEGEAMALLPAVRREVWALDPDVPIGSVATMEELLSDHLSRATFTLTLVGVAAAMALLLGGIGIYGVISYAVSRRRFEIGVRMALGARRGSVAAMVLRQTLVLALIGIGLGAAMALATMRLLSSLLFEVPPNDPLTLITVAAGLAAVAGIAGALPARRATRVDAVVALRRS